MLLIQLKLETKLVLRVYVDEDESKKYVEAAAAYALGLTNVRSIMTGTRYKEITNDVIEKLRERNYNIEFINLPKKIKQKIKVFYDDNRYYINTSSAYALGYIDVAKFNMGENVYGPLNDNEIKNIKIYYDIEFEKLNREVLDSKML